MNLIPAYLLIRIRQTFRLLQDAGWVYVLLLMPFVVVVLFALLESSLYGEWPLTALSFMLLICMFHFQRGDHDFLSRLAWPPFVFRLLDYYLLAIPVIIALLIVSSFRDVFILLLLLPVIALIRPPERKTSYRPGLRLSFIPLEAMEWRTAIRRYFWLILPLYIAAIATAQYTASPLAFTLIMALAATGFYDDLEEKDLLEVFMPASLFLRRKAYWQALCFHVLLLPHYVLFLIFNAEYWYLLLTVILIAESLLLFSLFYKYTLWRPSQGKAYNQMVVGLYAGGLIIPFLAPASLFYCWLYYGKAKENINYYYGRNK